MSSRGSGRLVIFATAGCAVAGIAYHVLGAAFPVVFTPWLSLAISAALCTLVAFAPSDSQLQNDILEPPRVLAVAYLFFFPVFAFAYLRVPWLEKWYMTVSRSSDLDHRFPMTVFLVCLSAPVFYAGYRAGFRHPARIFRRALFGETGQPNDRRIVLWCLLLTVVGAVGLLLFVRSLGGLSAVLDTMGHRTVWRGQGSKLAYHLGLFLVSAPATTALLFIYRRAGVPRLLAGAALLFAAASLMSLQATRLRALLPLLIVLIGAYYFVRTHRRRPMRLMEAGLVLVAIGVGVSIFVEISELRGSGAHEVEGTLGLMSEFNRIDICTWMYFDYFELGNGYLYGKPFVSHLLLPLHHLIGLPRIPTTPEVVAETIWGSAWRVARSGLPGAPLAAEAYVNFGYFGYLLFVVIGFFFGSLRRYVEQQGFRFWSTLLYSFLVYVFTYKVCIHSGLSSATWFTFVVSLEIVSIRMLSAMRWGVKPVAVGFDTSTRPLRPRHRDAS